MVSKTKQKKIQQFDSWEERGMRENDKILRAMNAL